MRASRHSSAGFSTGRRIPAFHEEHAVLPIVARLRRRGRVRRVCAQVWSADVATPALHRFFGRGGAAPDVAVDRRVERVLDVALVPMNELARSRLFHDERLGARVDTEDRYPREGGQTDPAKGTRQHQITFLLCMHVHESDFELHHKNEYQAVIGSRRTGHAIRLLMR